MGSQLHNKDELTSQSTVNNSPTEEKLESHRIHLNPVVMVLQPRDSASYTPLRVKELSCSNTVCRICHEDDVMEALISPCSCTGSLGLIHRHCLEKWLSTSNTDKCEICKYKFQISRIPKSVWQWLNSDGILGPKGFLGDFLCLLVLLPLSLISVYLCGFGAHKYIKHHEWEGTGLAMLCFFLLIAFFLWCCVTVRFHYKMYQDWQRKNQVIRIVMKKKGDDCAVEVNNNSHNEEAETVVAVTSIEGLELDVFDSTGSSLSNRGETLL